MLLALRANESGKLYALVDPAQDPGVIGRIAQDAAANACLFGYALDSPIAKATPRVVAILDVQSSALFTWIARHAPHKPVATLMISQLPLDALAEHLQQQMDVKLHGVGAMFLAFWDPSILGTLVGQADDETLHVAGPVLDAEQLRRFLSIRN
ncbi:MAG: DUF4123 domain-containing protein [Cytophagaceae bacterium]|nr:MAG: DUF4123 domain-containing protein [Cytophagaceae bacterium]